MKIYGFARFAFSCTQDVPEETICKKCYDARFRGLGKPSKMARYTLGYEDITSPAYARGEHCSNCDRPLA